MCGPLTFDPVAMRKARPLIWRISPLGSFTSIVCASRKLAWPRTKSKRPVLELTAPVVGKLTDQPPLARQDRRAVGALVFCPQPKLASLANSRRAMPAFEERFARHTAAQDAQPTDFLATLHDQRFQANLRRRSRSGVAPAAAADYDEVVGVCHWGRLAASTEYNR